MPMEAIESSGGYYFPISPLMLLPRSKGDFGVYLKIKNRYVLYAHPNEEFSAEHRRKLYENGVEEIYVLTQQRKQFERYVEENLGRFLMDDNLPMRERSRVFYNASLDIIKETFSSRLPGTISEVSTQKIKKFVTMGTKFLMKDKSLKNLASLISHDYQTYSHCVHVFVFTAAILQTYDLSEEQMIQYGLGAILHDIGKTKIPKHILNKKGRLDSDERTLVNTHPTKGVALCSKVSLAQETINCILFHHERFEGEGYPTGICASDLDIGVRAVTASDVYAAMTTNRPYANARKPFEALKIMCDDMNGHFDQDVIKRFIKVLSGAQVI